MKVSRMFLALAFLSTVAHADVLTSVKGFYPDMTEDEFRSHAESMGRSNFRVTTPDGGRGVKVTMGKCVVDGRYKCEQYESALLVGGARIRYVHWVWEAPKSE